MKTQELRIGNLINIIYWNPHPDRPSWEKNTCEIATLRSNTLVGVKINGWQIINKNIENIEPIILTDEWLIKFGFEKKTTDYIKKVGEKTIIIDFDKEVYGLPQVFYSPTKAVRFFNLETNIQYVHQLQNIYFAITVEELTIK